MKACSISSKSGHTSAYSVHSNILTSCFFLPFLKFYIQFLFYFLAMSCGMCDLSSLEGKKVKSVSRVQLFVTLWTTPWRSPLPGSSVHGIFQARVLEWVAISFSRGSSWPRDWTWVSHTVGRCFILWATCSLQWKCSLNHWTNREVPLYVFLRMSWAKCL